MCAKCRISKWHYHYFNVTVITSNCQVQTPEKERAQAANRGYCTLDLCILLYVYEGIKQALGDTSFVHQVPLQVLFSFISAEINAADTGLCVCVRICFCVVPSFLRMYASHWLCDDCSAGGWSVRDGELTGTSLWWSPSKRSTTATSTPINYSSYQL